MKKLLWLVIMILLISSCAQHCKSQSPAAKAQGRYIKVPRWFTSMPQGDFCLGFAKLTVNEAAVKISALQDATVSYCRDHNCYVVNKRAIRDTQINNGSGEQEFQVLVTSEPQQLYDIRDNLQLLDYFWFYDNFIGIYSLNHSQIDTTRVDVWCDEANTKKSPEWYTADLTITEDQVYSDVYASSSDLIDAWQRAVDNGRVKLASYNKIKVDASVWHINGERDKMIALETSYKMNRININKLFLKRYQGPGGPGYSVHLRMSMDKGA
ncbi:MAG: hypothetical protein K9M99_00750 [Candidatus Cloacimonetes bacterium]|nr:hypothetical protein [Candidatus Cloacimonadota bacterium]